MAESTGKVGRYELYALHATRVSGELYAAREAARAPGPHNLVALTLLPPRDTTQAAAKYLRPALAARSTFVHPGLAQHHDVFAHEGKLWVAHEWVRGETLRRLMGVVERAHSAVFAVSIALELARTLHAAHTYEDESVEPGTIVHGDVAPSTVMVTIDGRLVLVDAGLALAESRLSPERAGLRGHFAYLAPERAASRPDIGPAADVYGVGLLLYEILACAPPFEAATDSELIAQSIAGRLPPLASRVRVSPALSDLVSRATHVDPELRPTAGELAEELAGLRSARLAAWDLRAELAKVMGAHFGHRAQAMRTMEERWAKRAAASGRPQRIAPPPPRPTSQAAAFAPDADAALAALPAPVVDAGPTDDLVREKAPRPPKAPLSFVRGVALSVLSALMITVSTAWWPAEWRAVAVALGESIVEALRVVLSALGRW